MRCIDVSRIGYALLALVVATTSAMAHDYTAGGIHVAHPWSLALPDVARNGAAYMEISNRGERVDKLIDASSPIAKRVSLHGHTTNDGVLRMRPIEAIDVEPGTSSVLAPGGLHIMLMELKEPLNAGKRFPLTLTFEKAGKIEVQIVVIKDPPSGHGGHSSN
jgi:copper(I)-binding protein